MDPLGWARRRAPAHGARPSDRHLRKLLALPFLRDTPSFDVLAGLPEDWIPTRAEAEIAGFLRVAHGLSRYETCDARRRNRVHRDLVILLGSYDLLRPSRGRWAAFADRMMPVGNEPYLQLDEAVDMAVAFARQVVVPELFEAGLCDERYDVTKLSPAAAVAALVLFEGKGLQAILEEASAWHFVVGRNRGGRLRLGPPWAVPFESAVAPNGTVLRCLASDAELVEEGYAMSHCVGGYGADCRAGRAVIVSLRDPSGRRLATAELRPLGPSFTLAQQVGPRNGPCPPAAAEAVRWLLLDGLGTAVPIAPAFLERRRPDRGVPAEPDHDPAAATACWAPHLRRPLRDPLALRAAIAAAALRVVRDRFPPGDGVTPDGSLSGRPLRWPGVAGRGERRFDLQAWTRMRLAALPARRRDRLARLAGVGALPGAVLACFLPTLPLGPVLGTGALIPSLAAAIALPVLAMLADRTGLATRIARGRWERRAAAAAGPGTAPPEPAALTEGTPCHGRG